MIDIKKKKFTADEMNAIVLSESTNGELDTMILLSTMVIVFGVGFVISSLLTCMRHQFFFNFAVIFCFFMCCWSHFCANMLEKSIVKRFIVKKEEEKAKQCSSTTIDGMIPGDLFVCNEQTIWFDGDVELRHGDIVMFVSHSVQGFRELTIKSATKFSWDVKFFVLTCDGRLLHLTMMEHAVGSFRSWFKKL